MSYIENERTKKHALPFICLTETWLKSYIADAQVNIPGYIVSRSDRNNRIGGGVLLYTHEDIPLSSREIYDDGICQALFTSYDAVKMCVATVYRPPNAPPSSFSKVLKFLANQILAIGDDSFQLNIAGDFNFPNIDWQSLSVSAGASSDTNDSANALLSFMSNNLLNQYVLIPTHESNILDLFMSNNNQLVTNVTTSSSEFSKHSLVDVMISTNPSSIDKPNVNKFDENEFRSLDFNAADFDIISEELKKVDWEDLKESCCEQDFPVLFTETLFQICKSTVPKKKLPTGKPKAVNSLRRKKRKLNVRLDAVQSQEYPDEKRTKELKDNIALLCFEIKEAINHSLDYKELKAVEKIKSNPKFFYSYAKSHSQIKSSLSMLFNKEKNITTDPKEMADVLQDQFSSVYSDPNAPGKKLPSFKTPEVNIPFDSYNLPLTTDDLLEAIGELKTDSACGPDGIPAILIKSCKYELCKPIKMIWECSHASGTVPDYYKKAFVSPIYKKGNRAEAVNYRPVSLTSHVVKVYERVLRKVMVQYLEDNNLISCKQHGFRAGRSCLTQMLSHFDDIMVGLTEGMDTDSIYLDYAKAFDKVDHGLLLQKLQRYGFNSKVTSWIQSFLTNRSQSVVVSGHHSKISEILSGVPQGTVLGPLLFIIFINDLEHCVSHSNISFFADDTRICKKITCEDDVKLLQKDLDSVMKWSNENNMKLHEDKFELIIHPHIPKNPLLNLPFVAECMSYKISNVLSLQPVPLVKDLGVLVSSELSWEPHISSAVTRARSTAAWVLSVFKTRDTLVMMSLYKSLVRSILEYCCPLWNPRKVTEIQLLEGVQRTFTSRLCSVRHLDYWTRLQHLQIMSLQRRRERYIILQMWKILHNQSPNDIGVQFAPISRHGLRAKVPVISKNCRARHQSLYDSSFAVTGPRLWNVIPSELTQEADFHKFKITLTKFVKSIPDQPPVTGYTTINGNSLLDWSQNIQG